MSPVLMRSAVVAALGGFLFGFDTAVIAGTTRGLTHTYQLTPALLGFTVSSALWGTVLGSMSAAAPSDRFGRKAALCGIAAIYLISALGCALAWNFAALVFFRFLGGLAIGASSVVGPMYIAETAPASHRGKLVALFQLNIVTGILAAYLSNYLIGLAGLGPSEWRFKLGAAAIPALLFWITQGSIPESPRWLVKMGRTEEALRVLSQTGEPDPQAAFADIVESTGAERQCAKEALFQKKYRFPIFLAVSIGMFNQLSGINSILYYLNDIFERAGFDKVSSDLQAVVLGVTNLAITSAAMSVIDRLGRRKLLLTGAAGTALCLAGVAAVFAGNRTGPLVLWLLIAYIACFAFSQGAVIWVYLSEVFPTQVRAKGQSLGSVTHWLMNAIISTIFPVMAASSGAAPFVFFAAMTAVQFLVVYFLYPETCGISLEAMSRLNIR